MQNKHRLLRILIVLGLAFLPLFFSIDSAKSTQYVCDTYQVNGGDQAFLMTLNTPLKFGGTVYNGNVYVSPKGTLTFGQGDFTYWNFPSTPSISIAAYDYHAFDNNHPWGANNDLYVRYGSTPTSLCVDWKVLQWGQSSGNPVYIRLYAEVNPENYTWTPTIQVSSNAPAGARYGVRYTYNGEVFPLTIQTITEPPAPAPEPEPTPEPTPDPTPEPTPSETSTVTPEPEITPTPEPEVTPSPEPSDTSTVIVEPTPDPSPEEPDTSTPVIEPTPEPEPTLEPTPSDTNTAIVEPTPSPEPTPEPQPEPEPQPSGPTEEEIKAEQEKIRLEQEAAAALAAQQEAARQAALAEAQRIAAEREAARKAEEERIAKEKAEEEAKKKAEEEARIKAEEEARIKAEEEEKARIAEEERLKKEAEEKAKAEEEARLKAEEEARIKAEEEDKKKAEEEAKAKAEAQAKEKAEKEAAKPENVIANAASDGVITQQERTQISNALVSAFAEAAGVPVSEILKAGIDYEDLPPDTPVELDNGVILTAEIVDALQVFENPSEIFTDPAKAVKAFLNVGADMSPDVREKAEDIVVVAIVVGQIIVASSIMRR